jgi:hypothetical protein
MLCCFVTFDLPKPFVFYKGRYGMGRPFDGKWTFSPLVQPSSKMLREGVLLVWFLEIGAGTQVTKANFNYVLC